LDPTTTDPTGSIYDLDPPGCSTVLGGRTIRHNSETYMNFTQFVIVTLDKEANCSDKVPWSYQAQINGDNKAGSKVDLNKLDTKWIDWLNIDPTILRHYDMIK
jgi:hypothetical protein